jgi:DNA-binding LacI/PurR family transcriptional regulator
VSSEKRRASANRGSNKPGLVAVARVLGVSPTTVSNAYNRPDQLSPALRERVLRTAAELGYAGPDPVARSLRRGRAGALGVVFSERLPYAFDDPGAVRFLQGLAQAAGDEQLAVLLVPGSPGRSTQHGQAVRNAAVDGFVLHSLPDDDPVVEATRERRLPTVIVDAPAIDGLDFVGIDDRAAAETAVRHLLDLGHRRLAVLSFRLGGAARQGPVDMRRQAQATASVATRRLEGCAHALASAGLDWSRLPVEECPTTSVQAGRAGAHALLDRAPGITALFALSDPLALGVKLAARERGLAVPGDLSIIGFDDTAAASDDLTSIHQPQRDKGRIAAERLIRAMSADPPPPRHELLPTRLVPRGSTAPPGGP